VNYVSLLLLLQYAVLFALIDLFLAAGIWHAVKLRLGAAAAGHFLSTYVVVGI
jgi:hypothetical protein